MARGVSLFGAFVLVAGMTSCSALYNYGTEDEVTFTVTDKERIVESNGETTSSRYLIFTNGEVFENTDSLLRLKFNSADIQGQLREGDTYDATVYGWRVPFLSMNRNIVDVRPKP